LDIRGASGTPLTAWLTIGAHAVSAQQILNNATAHIRQTMMPALDFIRQLRVAIAGLEILSPNGRACSLEIGS
jgi:hypothetical protein